MGTGERFVPADAALPSEDGNPTWLDVVRQPFVAAILGGKGSGKSVIGHRLLEVFSDEGYDPHVVGLAESREDRLPDDYSQFSIVEMIEEHDGNYYEILRNWPEGSIVLFDVPIILARAGDAEEEVLECFDHLSRNIRNVDTCLVFETGKTSLLNRATASEVDTYLVRYPGMNQEQEEYDFARPIVERARDELEEYSVTSDDRTGVKRHTDDYRRYVYVETEAFVGKYPHEVSTPDYWDDPISRQHIDIDEENTMMVDEEDILAAINQARSTDIDLVETTAILDILKEQYGDFYPEIVLDELDTLVEDGYCERACRADGEHYYLTQRGRRRLRTPVGDSPTGGNGLHRNLIYTVTDRLSRAGFDADSTRQIEGKVLPDARARVPIDMTASSVSEMEEKWEQLREQYPEVAAITDGRDIHIEVETDPGSGHRQMLANLSDAIEQNKKCMFCVKRGEGDEDEAHHARKLAKKLLNPSCKVKASEDGRERLYSSKQTLTLAEGETVLRPKDPSKTQWWKTPGGAVELRTANASDPLIRFDSVEDIEEPQPEDVPAFSRYDRKTGRYVIQRRSENKYETLGEYEKGDIGEEWREVKEPFVPELYVDGDEIDDWWTIVVVPEDGDGPLLQYHPEVTDDGCVKGELRPLFDTRTEEYRTADGIEHTELFEKNTATHWLLYLLAAWEDDETTLHDHPTSKELYGYATGPECIALETPPATHPFPALDDVSTRLSELARSDDELISRRGVDFSERDRCRHAYSLTDRGWRAIVDAGIPSELPDRNRYSEDAELDVAVRYDPRTTKLVEATCDICGEKTGSLIDHARMHALSSTVDFSRPITENTMGHWVMFALCHHHRRTGRPMTAADLSERIGECDAVGSETALSTNLGELAEAGLATRRREAGTNAFEYEPTETGRFYLDTLGRPKEKPERTAPGYDRSLDVDPKELIE